MYQCALIFAIPIFLLVLTYNAFEDLSRSIEVTSESYIAVGTFSTIWVGKWKPKYDRPGVVRNNST